MPFRDADLLIIDEIGKDISGSGMDTNVVGRKRAFRPAAASGQAAHAFDLRARAERTHPRQRRRHRPGRLHHDTAGQGHELPGDGHQLPDGRLPRGAFLPVYFDSDREVLDAALAIIGTRRPDEARVLRIKNTLRVEELEATEACLAVPSDNGELQVLAAAPAPSFDAAGNLSPV